MPLKRRSVWLLVAVGALVVGGGIWGLWLSPWSPWASQASSGSNSEVALVVNGEVIPAEQLEEAFQEFVRAYRAALPSDERLQFDRQLAGAPGAYYRLQLKAQIAEELIRKTLLQQAARELGAVPKQSEVLREVERKIWKFLEQNGVPPERIERALKDPKTWRSPFTRRLIRDTRQELLEERLRLKVTGPIEPTEEALRAYYERYRLRYYTPELVRVRHILVRVPEDAPPERVEAARKRIEQIYEEWKAGARFEELARRYSEDPLTAPQGGDYGWIQRGDPTGEEFVELAFSLREPGEVGGPVRTKRGFHLVQLVERRPERGATFESVRDEVLKDYVRETTQARYAQWYEERRARAQIEVKDPLLAAYWLEAKDREAARRAYERIRDEGLSDDPYLGYYIARLYRLELDEVERELEKLPPDDPKARELQARVEALTRAIVRNLKAVLAAGQPERGLFEEILELAPDDVGTRFEFARWLMEQGRWEEAAEQLARVVELDPERAQAHALYGRLLLELDRLPEAVQHLERALELLPPEDEGVGVGDLKLMLARAYERLGRAEEARALWTDALRDDPKNVEAHRGLARLAQARGDVEGAIKHLEAALKAGAGAESEAEERARLWVEIGRLRLQTGDLERAEEAFRRALKEHDNLPEAYLGLGDLARQRGDEARALKLYRQGWERAVGWAVKEQLALRMLALQPDDVELRFELAKLYEQRRRYDEAIAQYQRVVQLRPEALRAWHALGDLYRLQGRYDEAIQAYEEGLRRAGSPEQQVGLWAKIYYAERDRGRAAGSALSPKGLEALYRLARLEAARGRYEEAANYLSKLLEADPTYREAEVRRLVEQLRRQGFAVPMPSSAPSGVEPGEGEQP